MRTLGAILAGGRSTRFGSDKAAAVWRGRDLLDHVRDALCPAVDGIVICGRTVPGERCLPDRPAADLGPLGGLNAALAFAAASGFERVLSVPCDVPTLPRNLIDRLLACDGAAFLVEQPVIGIWPASLVPNLDRFVAIDPSRSMRRWTDAIGALPLAGPAPANVNRPADLAALD